MYFLLQKQAIKQTGNFSLKNSLQILYKKKKKKKKNNDIYAMKTIHFLDIILPHSFLSIIYLFNRSNNSFSDESRNYLARIIAIIDYLPVLQSKYYYHLEKNFFLWNLDDQKIEIWNFCRIFKKYGVRERIWVEKN